MFSHSNSAGAEAIPPLSDVTGSKLQQFNSLLAEMLPPTHLFPKLNPSIQPQELFASELCNSRTFLRARPLLAEEISGQKPCTSLPFVKLVGKRDGVLVTFKMTPNGNPLLEPYRIPLDGGIFCSFAGKDTNDDVYEAILPPILARCSQGNGAAAVMMYGALGSGKTYTTRGLVECLTQDMMAFLDSTVITMNVLELHALGIMDVLTGEDVQMLENQHNPDGTGVKLVGATDFRLQSSTTIKKVLNLVFAVRDKNPRASALSTMVFRFLLLPKTADPDVVKCGQIFIVDLASFDALASASLAGSGIKAQKELSRNIVSSFAAYRDCIRLRVAQMQTTSSGNGPGGAASSASGASQEELPFRTSPLTLLLNACFNTSSRFAKMATICCVSPHISQMKTIGDTIKFAASLCAGTTATSEEKVAFAAASTPDPFTWSVAKMHEFLVQASCGRLRNPQLVFSCPDARSCIELINTDEAIDKMVDLHGYPKRVFQSMWNEMLRVLLEQKGTNASSLMLAKKQQLATSSSSSALAASTSSSSFSSGGGTGEKGSGQSAKGKFAQVMKVAVQQQLKKEGKAPSGGSKFVEVVKQAVRKAQEENVGQGGGGSNISALTEPAPACSSISSSAPLLPTAPSASSPNNPRGRSLPLSSADPPHPSAQNGPAASADKPLVDFEMTPSVTPSSSGSKIHTAESSLLTQQEERMSSSNDGQHSLPLSLSLGAMSGARIDSKKQSPSEAELVSHNKPLESSDVVEGRGSAGGGGGHGARRSSVSFKEAERSEGGGSNLSASSPTKLPQPPPPKNVTVKAKSPASAAAIKKSPR